MNLNKMLAAGTEKVTLTITIIAYIFIYLFNARIILWNAIKTHSRTGDRKKDTMFKITQEWVVFLRNVTKKPLQWEKIFNVSSKKQIVLFFDSVLISTKFSIQTDPFTS